jgi:acid phosphatase
MKYSSRSTASGVFVPARWPLDPARIESLEARMLLSAAALPRPDHIVVVIEEDHAYDQLLGPVVPGPAAWPNVLPNPLSQDPYLRQIASLGASMTDMTSVGHPNSDTYQAMFSGIKPPPDYIPPTGYNDPNIASELIASGMTFGGYSESLPRVGYTGDDVGEYARQHNAWVDFNNVPASDNMPFSKFPKNYNDLPTVSYVIPNADDNMHSGWVSSADQWLHQNLSGYAKWAMKHNSLLVVTWDESHEPSDQIPTIFFGPMVQSGNYAEPVTQMNLLATLEGLEGLPATGRSATAAPISDIFNDHGLSEPLADAGAAANPLNQGQASIQGTISLLDADVAAGGDKSRPNGWWVYLDTNGDGQFEAGEPLDLTYRRHFHFKHLAAGNYVVRVVQQDGFQSTSSSATSVSVSLGKRSHVSHVRFSEQRVDSAS